MNQDLFQMETWNNLLDDFEEPGTISFIVLVSLMIKVLFKNYTVYFA